MCGIADTQMMTFLMFGSCLFKCYSVDISTKHHSSHRPPNWNSANKSYGNISANSGIMAFLVSVQALSRERPYLTKHSRASYWRGISAILVTYFAPTDVHINGIWNGCYRASECGLWRNVDTVIFAQRWAVDRKLTQFT